MRKVVVTEFMTLDGVVEAPDKWSFPYWNDEIAKFKFDELVAGDALLLGRVTYEGFAAAWPKMTETEGEFAERMNGYAKHVASTTLKTLEWNNSHLIEGSVADEITKLKQQDGRDILLAGSPQLAQSLMPLNVIDEYRLLVYPIVIGKGKRLFKDEGGMKAMTLADTRAMGSGVVLLSYEPAPKA